MSTLITGAAGFIGSHTVSAFLRHQQPVVGVDDLSGGSLKNLTDVRESSNFTFVEGDITDYGYVSNLIRRHRIRKIVHLAGMVGVTQSINNPAENFRLNVAAVDGIARAAIVNACTRLVFASSAAVYGTPTELPLNEDRSPCAPLSPYGAAKLAAEKLLEGYARTSGLECVVLRYFNVYGPGQDPTSEYSGVISRFCARLSAGGSLTIHGDGHQTRDFVYVGDVAQVNLNATLASTAVAGTYNVSTGVKTSINELTKLMADLLNVKSVIRYSEARSADIPHSCGDPAKLRTTGLVTGFTPLRAGLCSLLSCSLADLAISSKADARA